MQGKITVAAGAAVLAAALATLFILGCSSGPEFNPLPVGAGSRTPALIDTPHAPVTGAASPTATNTSESPTASPTAATTPTPTPGLLIFDPTPAPPSPVLDPAEYVMASLRQLEYRDSMSVRSTVTLDAVANSKTSAAGREAAVTDSAISVLVEGDYAVSYIDTNVFRNGVSTVRSDRYQSFHLRFFNGSFEGEDQVNAGADGLPDAELEAVEGRFVTDTTDHNFEIHETHWDLLEDMYPGPRPNAAMFLSLALSGGRIVELNLNSWIEFAPGEVRLTGTEILDGNELQVFEAHRTRLGGDVEQWTFWIGTDGLLRRIELNMSNERIPARNIQSAELEFLSWGDCMEGYACGW